MDDDAFKNRYNTELSPEEEVQYQDWIKAETAKRKRDVSKDEIDYDMRGDWKAGASRDARGHGADTFKKPNHPTFSENSQYHNVPDEEGNVQVGGKWVQDKKGRYVGFQPSETNARHWPDWALQQYLSKAEPGIKLQKRKP